MKLGHGKAQIREEYIGNNSGFLEPGNRASIPHQGCTAACPAGVPRRH